MFCHSFAPFLLGVDIEKIRSKEQCRPHDQTARMCDHGLHWSLRHTLFLLAELRLIEN